MIHVPQNGGPFTRFRSGLASNARHTRTLPTESSLYEQRITVTLQRNG